MKRAVKITLTGLLVLFVVVFANGCHYVFCGVQRKHWSIARRMGTALIIVCL